MFMLVCPVSIGTPLTSVVGEVPEGRVLRVHVLQEGEPLQDRLPARRRLAGAERHVLQRREAGRRRDAHRRAGRGAGSLPSDW